MKTKKIPVRRCVGCREMKDKNQCLRIVKSSENKIEIDLTGKKNGRGAYLCKSKECMEKALKNNSLERSFHVAIPDEIKSELLKEMDHIENV